MLMWASAASGAVPDPGVGEKREYSSVKKSVEKSRTVFAAFVILVIWSPSTLAAEQRNAVYPRTVSFDVGGLLGWLGDQTLLVAELNYRCMPARIGFDGALAYRTSALAFDDVPLVSAYIVYAGPVFRLGEFTVQEGFWIRSRLALAYATVHVTGNEATGAFFEDGSWFGVGSHVGYTFRARNDRVVIDPYVGLQYLFGYFFPGIGLYLGYSF